MIGGGLGSEGERFRDVDILEGELCRDEIRVMFPCVFVSNDSVPRGGGGSVDDGWKWIEHARDGGIWMEGYGWMDRPELAETDVGFQREGLMEEEQIQRDQTREEGQEDDCPRGADEDLRPGL